MELPPVDSLAELDDVTLTTIRTRFRELGFAPEILAAAESLAPGQLDAVSLPLVRAVLRQRRDPASSLARLFTYGEVLARVDAQALLGDVLVTALVRSGLLEAAPGTVRCPYRLVPLEGLYLVGDEPWAGTDAVMGPGPTTLELVDQLPLECNGSVLDIGTGAGTLALIMAARGSPKVLATDLSERATALARFNARLNGLTVEVRQGDLGEPVRGERFDWVVAQPSYVFHVPGSAEVIFLHGGARGDELAFRLLEQVPSLLEEAGTAVVLFDAPADPQRALAERVRRAVGDRLDAVLLASPGPSVNAQAVAYAALADPTLGASYAEAVERNRDHLNQLGLTDWTHLLVILKATRRESSGFTAQFPVPVLRQREPGARASLLAALETALLADSDLLSTRLRLHPGAIVSGVLNRDGSWTATVRGGAGAFISACEIGPEDLHLFRVLPANPSLKESLEQLRGDPFDRQIGRVRELLGRGILIPAAGERPQATEHSKAPHT